MWHDEDKPPGWRLFVQIQDIPNSQVPAYLQGTNHILRYNQEGTQNTLLGAAQVGGSVPTFLQFAALQLCQLYRLYSSGVK